MTGTMQIEKLKKRAAYYYQKDYDERFGGQFIFFIVPLIGSDDNLFYYVKQCPDGKLEISGEAHTVKPERISHYMREARESMGEKHPMYYWLNENGEVTCKTYL